LYFIPETLEHFFSPRQQHVCQQIGEQLNKTKKISSLSGSQFSRKIMPTDTAGAMKVSQKITTQHGQLIFRKIFTKDLEPNSVTDTFVTEPM